MKKNLIILTLALLIALPVLGLAADVSTPVTPELQATGTTPLGGQYGRRWNQTPVTPNTTIPQSNYVDADNDGICDICGVEQGKNIDAPNYIDENKDGLCDHYGTDLQGQGTRNMQSMRGRNQQAQGQGAQGNMQSMRGRNQQAQGQGVQGNVKGLNYADTNNDGVCDNFGTDTQQNFGGGRNRR